MTQSRILRFISNLSLCTDVEIMCDCKSRERPTLLHELGKSARAGLYFHLINQHASALGFCACTRTIDAKQVTKTVREVVFHFDVQCQEKTKRSSRCTLCTEARANFHQRVRSYTIRCLFSLRDFGPFVRNSLKTFGNFFVLGYFCMTEKRTMTESNHSLKKKQTIGTLVVWCHPPK